MNKNFFINSNVKIIKNTNKIVVLLLFLVLYSLFFIPSSADAQTLPQQALRISPIINDLKLTPGKPTKFQITIQNVSQNPVGIHADINGLDALGDTPDVDQNPSAMVGWTILSNTDLLLGAKEKKSINVTINTPANIGESGYYETIFLTPILHQEQVAWAPIILSRIGVLVLGTNGNLNYDNLAKKVSITEMSPSQTLLNTFPMDISFSVVNKYFTHFDAKPFLTITPLFGNPQTILLTDKHVLPGSTRIWEYQPTTKTPDIFYRLHIAVSVGDGKQVYADSWFIVLPYKLIIIIVIIAAILYFGFFKRNRVKKAIKILLHDK